MGTLSGGLKRYAKSPGDQDITGRNEWQLYHKNGHLIWVEAETNFLRDDHGKPIKVISVSRDISERKKAEEEKAELKARLRQSEERYLATLESIEEGYFESNLSGEFTFVSDWMATSLGRSREELIGMTNRGICPLTQARKYIKLLSGSMKPANR